MKEKITIEHVNRFLLLGVLLCLVLYYARQVLIPVSFGIFFAMLFTPMANRLERAGLKRGWSSAIPLLVIVVAVTGIILLVYMQSMKLADKKEEITKKSEQFLERSQNYLSEKLKVPVDKQDELITKQLRKMMESSGRVLKDFITGFVGLAGMFVIVLIFTFLFLFQRDKYEAFFIQVFGNEQKPDETKRILGHISKVAQSYLTGRVISILIFTVLFSIGFLIVGIESAFLLAFIAALLTIIPYVGSIIGGIFPFAVALVTSDINTAIGALAVIAIVQGIDNYFIEPYIIGGEVSISAFFSILILIVGGMLWGVAGMILFLPMLGVAKIIFDTVPGLRAYGYLIGDQEQDKPSQKFFEKIKKIFRRK